jgi:hypothetical protein
MSGKSTRLFVSTAGTTTTTVVEVEFQGDLVVNTGKTLKLATFKNGSVASHGNSGWSTTIDVAARIPVPAGQGHLMSASTNETPLYIEVKGATGSLKWSGVVNVALTEDVAPTDDTRMLKFSLMENGVVAQGVTT